MSGLVLFYNLWGKSLENHGYVRYAEIAREMIRSGEWVVPHYNGEIYIEKPPLLFWLMAIPSWFYGSVTPLIARLPSAVAAWAVVMVLFLWGRRVYGSVQSGLISGGLCLMSFQFFFEARNPKTDMVFCLMIVLSLYFFYRGYDTDRRKSYGFYGLSFFCMGLGTLTKGPVGMVIPILIVAAFLLKERQIKILVSRELLGTLRSEAELASVLAHEAGHIELGHCFDAVRFQLLARKGGSEEIGRLADLAAAILLRHTYGKTSEHEADEYAYALLRASRYDY